MAMSTGTRPATGGAQIHKWIDNCANQFHTQYVQGRMFDRVLVVCRKFSARIRELLAKRVQPQWTTRIVLAVLLLMILAHRAGMAVPSGLLRTWHAAEHEIILLKDRAQEDYQSLQLIYQATRQIRNLQEQQTACAIPDPTRPHLDRKFSRIQGQ